MWEPREIELQGHRYQIGKLQAFKQFHLTRKLLPLFSGIGESVGDGLTSAPIGSPTFWHALGPLANAIAKMSDAESEWILKTCLTACAVFNGERWVALTTPSGDLMFNDIEMPVLLQLAIAVMQDNLESFFQGGLLNGSGLMAPNSPLPTPP